MAMDLPGGHRPGSPTLAGRSSGRPLRRRSSFRWPGCAAPPAGPGGTVNDVFVAAVIGGLRLYHAKRGTTPPELRMGIPVSTRSAAGGQ